MYSKRTFACHCALAAGLLLAVNPLRGATLVVTNLGDAGPGTLRGIISGPLMAGDTVQFDPGLSGKTILLTSGEIQLDQNVTIDASALPGGITINGNQNSRIFEVFNNVSATLTSLTLSNGYATSGGAVLNSGLLLATLCTFAGNTVYNGGGGGAIANNLGSVGLLECTIADNSAAGGVGGGIFNLSSGHPVVLDQCTVSGNSAGAGGGFSSVNLGPANVSTLAVKNSIIAGNTADSYSDLAPDPGAAPPTQQGVNLIGGNPQLAPLGNYGGPMPTQPPRPGSPAIDGCTNGSLFSIDQRGYPRIVGPFEDIGAVELQTAELQTPMLVVTNSSDSGPGSLRQTVSQVDITATISFASNLSGATITLTSGVIALNKNLVIDASALPGGIQIDGNHSSAIFSVMPGPTVGLASLTLVNANNNGTQGGAILNSSVLTISNCTLSGNQAANHDETYGGAIYNDGTLTLTDSTLSSNNCSGFGGAIFNNGTLTMLACTLSGNYAYAAAAIYNNGTVNYTNCIVAGNSPYNLGGTGPFNGANNLTSGNPMLAPPGNYGGPTQTMPPLPGSPAIDAGNDAAASGLATDQRGAPRLAGAHVDIGAVETQLPVVTTTADAGPGSLRDVVKFALPGSTVTFNPNLSGQTILLTSGELPLNQNLAIDGSSLPGGLTISGNNASRIFNVGAGANVSLNSLTLTGGFGEPGGAIYTAGGSTLTISRCTLSGNSGFEGGAILNDGVLGLLECTLSGNNAGYGGALQCRGPATVSQCTISGNDAYAGGGGIFDKFTTLVLINSIVAGNTPAVNGQDVYVQFAALLYSGANLVPCEYEQNPSAPTTGPAPFTNAPLLAPLGNYGGTTQTMPPLPGSPAVDACTGGSIFTTDQRGLPRLSGAYVDIGAAELQVAAQPFPINSFVRLAAGDLQLGFTNVPNVSFTILATTNVALPLNSWSILGPAVESPVSPGYFTFTDSQATNNPARFYRVRSP